MYYFSEAVFHDLAQVQLSGDLSILTDFLKRHYVQSLDLNQWGVNMFFRLYL